MYRYTNKSNLTKLILSGRQAYVVSAGNIKDVDEYINNCLIGLKSEGFDTNKLTQPLLFKDKENKYIILVVREKFRLDEQEVSKVRAWANKMGNVATINILAKIVMMD